MSDGFEIFDNPKKEPVPGMEKEESKNYEKLKLAVWIMILAALCVTMFFTIKTYMLISEGSNVQQIVLGANSLGTDKGNGYIVVDAADETETTTASAVNTTIGGQLSTGTKTSSSAPTVASSTEKTIVETTTVAPSNGKININTATLDELMTLNGIGPTKAQAIIDYRYQNGNFNSVEELIYVSGIGEKTLEKIRDSITVG